MSRAFCPTCAQHSAGAGGFRAEGGQALIESIVTFGLLLVLIVGIVNFGLIFRTLISITNAANVAATYASTNTALATNSAGILAAALAESDGWNCDNPGVTSQVGADGDGNPSVTVTVRCTVVDLIALPALPGELTVAHTVTRRILP